MKPKIIAKKSNTQLAETAKKNTTVTKKHSRDEPITLIEGTPLDHATKHQPTTSEKPVNFLPKVGCSVGVTLNMDNYESMRIDAWLTDEVHPNESKEVAFERIYKIVKECVAKFSADFQSA